MTDEALLKIAQNLFSGYQKDTTGQVTHLKDADPDTRQLWLRAAKRAVRIIAKLSESHLDPTASRGKSATTY
jgi:hypothetical protein